MNRTDAKAGFYGKLPSHGDFLSRRLPRQFIEPWDDWLQGGIAASREQLGRQWLDTFLFSPIWHFGLTPGLCGEDAWAGVLMPSVDKVGRYYPLTLVAKTQAKQLTQLFAPDCGWFEALSKLALSTLEYEFDLQRFDEELARLSLLDYVPEQTVMISSAMARGGSGKMAFQFQLDNDRGTPDAFCQLGNALAERFLSHCSIWRTAAHDEEKTNLLFCEGLPPRDAYVGFLNGQWPQHGWQLACNRIQARAVQLAASSVPEAVEAVSSSGSATQMLTPGTDASALSASLQSFGLSVVGQRRKLNEDAILIRSDAGMWAVADGMGGHSAGDVASQTLISALAQIPPVDDLEHCSEQVASTLQTVNRQLVQLAKSRGSGQIIGSTIVVLLVSGNQFRYLWAGDSRLYCFREGRLTQLTQDHSLYNESISQGLLPEEGSLEQGRGNIITRAVGADAQLQLDWGQGEILPGDLFILSSDGLDKELQHADIAGYCSSSSVEDITRNLINEAETRGGRDNISVIVVKP